MKIADFIIPFIIFGIVIYGLFKGIDVFSVFVKGAKEGLRVVMNIFPVLVCLLMVIQMFTASGAMELLCSALSPVAHLIGVPQEVLPLALIRPVSGSGSLTVCQQLLHLYQPDSFIGRTASVLQGSSETTFYTIAVYFGAVGIYKTRYTIPAALVGDFVGLICSAFFVRLFLGG